MVAVIIQRSLLLNKEINDKPLAYRVSDKSEALRVGDRVGIIADSGICASNFGTAVIKSLNNLEVVLSDFRQTPSCW